MSSNMQGNCLAPLCEELRAHGARERLSGLACPHVLPFQAFLESDKAAYLLRPHVFADLYHRLSTRPFLSAIEKAGSHSKPCPCRAEFACQAWGTDSKAQIILNLLL